MYADQKRSRSLNLRLTFNKAARRGVFHPGVCAAAVPATCLRDSGGALEAQVKSACASVERSGFKENWSLRGDLCGIAKNPAVGSLAAP